MTGSTAAFPSTKPVSKHPAKHPAKRIVGHPRYGKRALERPSNTVMTYTPAIKRAFEAIVFDGLSRKEAAAKAGVSDGYLIAALNAANIRCEYDNLLQVLRHGIRPRAVHKLAHLMDTSDSERIQLDAAKYLDGQANSNGININVGVQTNITPGYIVDVSEHDAAAREILQHAGSTKSIHDKG